MDDRKPQRATKPGRSTGEVDAGIPLRFGDDPYVWACWLYYEDGLTQGEIADAMGISRATVNAYLAEARERGIVNISIDPSRLSAITIAEELTRHFGLEDCLVVPSDDGGDLIDRLGVAGARALAATLKAGDTLGVVWGRTVLAIGERLRVPPLDDMTVVQATGSLGAGVPFTPDLAASTFARALGATCINISAPAVVGTAALRDALIAEPLIAGQVAALSRCNRIVFGVASLRANSTLHASGFLDAETLQPYIARGAAGALAGRFFDERGQPVAGPLDGRIIGIEPGQLRSIRTRIAVAGGFDKVPALLGMLRAGHATVLVTDAATGRGILHADGVTDIRPRNAAPARPTLQPRMQVKKFLNRPGDVVEEMLDGALRAHDRHLMPVDGARRALMARTGPRPGKVGLVIGGGAGHEPAYLGYVGRGFADAVVVGNVFSAPPPAPIARCIEAVNGGAGVLCLYGNYAGDVMNFAMAAERAEERGIRVVSVATTDDIASAPPSDREGRRGVAGSVLIMKVVGAACDLGLTLDACAGIARRANARTYTVGVALEPGSLPQVRRPSFEIGPDDMEMGVGVHGEPGVQRERIRSADAIVDSVMERIFAEMGDSEGARVAVLVNSFGATPMMELYILYRRVEQRLSARGVTIAAKWVGPLCTSLDMVGASISVMKLDDELSRLLDHPCDTAAMQIA